MKHKNLFAILVILCCSSICYTQDGIPDFSFGISGLVTTNIDTADEVTSAVLQPDGKIVVIGESGHWKIGGGYYHLMIRYNPDGNIDSSFSDDGIVVIDDYKEFLFEIGSIAIQDDGKIILCGLSDEAAIMRFQSNGLPDSSFGVNGVYETSCTWGGDVFKCLIQPDNKILFSYKTDSWYNTIIRLNPDGTLDNTFGDEGTITEYVDQGWWFSMEQQPDGKIIVGGYAYIPPFDYTDFLLIRYNEDGTQDNTFGDDGFVVTDFLGLSDHLVDVAVRPDGGIVATGFACTTEDPCTSKAVIACYTSDGMLDETFDGDGKIELPGRGFYSLAIQANNKILVGGPDYENSYASIIRFNTDGTFDETFSDDGFVTTDGGMDQSEFDKVLIQPDGKIIGAGNNSESYVARDIILARFENTETSVNDLNNSNNLTVFPNPFTNQFIVEMNERTGAGKLQLFDLMGNLILDQTVNSLQITIITEKIPNGIYFLKYFPESANENFNVIKIVKQ